MHGEPESGTGVVIESPPNKPADDDGERLRSVSADAKYRSYMNLYNSFDTIIWGNSRNFIAITVIGMGLIGTASGNEKIALLPYLDHDQTIGLGVALVGLLYFLSVLVMARTRFHHSLLGQELRKLEGDGYFAKRAASISQPWKSAPHWHIVVFSGLALIAITLGAAMLLELSVLVTAHFSAILATGVYIMLNDSAQVASLR